MPLIAHELQLLSKHIEDEPEPRQNTGKYENRRENRAHRAHRDLQMQAPPAAFDLPIDPYIGPRTAIIQLVRRMSRRWLPANRRWGFVHDRDRITRGVISNCRAVFVAFPTNSSR